MKRSTSDRILTTHTGSLPRPEDLIALHVARQEGQWAKVVGAENLIVGTDCGFGTFVGLGTVHPKVGWWKLKSLAEGAAMASKTLSSSRDGRRVRRARVGRRLPAGARSD